jgi:hypothetical protein
LSKKSSEYVYWKRSHKTTSWRSEGKVNVLQEQIKSVELKMHQS